MPKSCKRGVTKSGRCRRMYTKACKKGKIREAPNYLCRKSSNAIGAYVAPFKPRIGRSTERMNALGEFGFTETPDPKTLKKLYHKRALLLHSDKNRGPKNDSPFQRLNNAYHKLTD